jgi:hypothetical protein
LWWALCWCSEAVQWTPHQVSHSVGRRQMLCRMDWGPSCCPAYCRHCWLRMAGLPRASVYVAVGRSPALIGSLGQPCQACLHLASRIRLDHARSACHHHDDPSLQSCLDAAADTAGRAPQADAPRARTRAAVLRAAAHRMTPSITQDIERVLPDRMLFYSCCLLFFDESAW